MKVFEADLGLRLLSVGETKQTLFQIAGIRADRNG